jgi:penicillin G amidase
MTSPARPFRPLTRRRPLRSPSRTGTPESPTRRRALAPRSLRPAAAAALLLALLVPALAWGQERTPPAPETITLVPGLDRPVQILRDHWGVPHIYAETERDLFFAQGYNAARDRLFQLEIWRRQATGTVAEILGPREIPRDHGARLFRFRGDMDAEMRHYHPRGHEIIPAFVAGINAYVDQTRTDPALLPIEFGLLGIEPGHWTPEVVISRHQGLLGNAGAQLSMGRAVHLVGAEAVKRLQHFHPHQPDIELDPEVDGAHLLEHDVLELYRAYRSSIDFRPEDVAPDHRADAATFSRLAAQAEDERRELERLDFENLGSNNWVVRGELAQNDFPMMVNDPHRVQQAPPLRYWVHLNAPGWNVIGGGEPAIPGVSIGHNGFGAWGLTIFRIDHEDLFVYRTNPADPNQYRYGEGWEEMGVILDTIRVKGADPVAVDLRYTHHGPVVYRDEEARVAYAVGAAWMEVGGAPYLASLRMNQAGSWEEFREAVTYNHVPGENMVWADRSGTIGWQAGGIAPIRRNFSGLVPVPGDGRFEWDGFLPIEELPHEVNPARGYIATANANVTSPFDYERLDEAIYFLWADPFRQARVNEVLASGRRFNLMDMARLQHDYLSIPARTLTPLLRELGTVTRGGEEGPGSAEGEPGSAWGPGTSALVEEARRRLLDWDHVLDRNSVEAGIYVAFERRLAANVEELFVPPEARPHLSLGLTRIIDFLLAPPGEFGSDPISGRDELLMRSLAEAVEELRERLGPDLEGWRYGQAGYKHALIRHPLASAVSPTLQERLNVGPAPRGGYAYTVGNTGSGDNQTSGASFRILVDTRDWDLTLGMSAPGQSGDPDSPFYDNLFELWANDRLFPVFYSRDRIEEVTAERLELRPPGR